MEPFDILLVEDDPNWVRTATENLESYKAVLTESPDRKLAVDIASNQVEAIAKALGPASKKYDLILLDLEYPENDDKNTLAFRGHTWLRELRQAQPSAAIAITTGYAHEKHLQKAVIALRDGRADEFIPKDAPWDETIRRLQAALVHRHVALQLARLRAVAAADAARSNVERTSSEDLLLALNRAEGKLERLKSQNGAALPSETVSQAFNELRTEVEGITKRLRSRFETVLVKVNCDEFVEEQGVFFEPQLRSRITPACLGDCRVFTYAEDLKVALREVLQNAADAVAEAGDPTPDPVNVSVERKSELDAVIISIRDRGKGFDLEAMARLFEPGGTFWSRDKERHKGMGLYVARRMMLAIGGDLEVSPAEGGGTEVRLVVRDWGGQ